MKIKLLFLSLILLIGSQGCRKAVSSHTNANRISEQQTKSITPQSEISTPQSESVTSQSSTNNNTKQKLEGQEIFDKYASAVFMVFTSDGFNGYQGSGFFLDNNGLAVSNYHVFKGTGKGMEKIKLLGSDDTYNVIDVIHSSEEEDFILFRVNCSNNNYLPIASNRPKIGERVYAIGSPRGLENTFSSGEVSQWRDTYLMQVSALLDHGSSGGALINEYGEVVGITSGSFADGSQANLNYAWSIDAVKPYLK